MSERNINLTEEFKPLDEAKIILNNFNYNTYNKVLNILSESDRCAVVQPTGTGKTYIMMSLLRHFKGTQKIVIAPSADFLSHIKENKFWKFNEENGKENEVNTFTYAKLCKNKLQLSLLLDIYKINPSNVSLIIIDEMHRVGAEEWSIAINNLITLCPNAKVVGLTATPKRYREDRNMAEEFFKDKVACNINLADAVKLGMLRKLDYVVGISDKYKNSNRVISTKSNNETINEITNFKYTEYIQNWNFDKYFESTLKKYLDTSKKVGKYIIFVNKVEEANSIEKYIRKAFNNVFKTNRVKIYQCHTGVKNSDENIKEFFNPHIDEFNSKNELKSDIRVAITINKLSESYHDKELKAIIMMNRTQSINTYIQQVGRLFNGVSNEDINNNNTVSKTGNPIIFDFLDSLNSLNRLKEDILSCSLSKEDNDSIYNCVFENYYNETSKFVKEVNKLKTISDINSNNCVNELVKLFKDSFSELTTTSCIYDLEQYNYLFENLKEIEDTFNIDNYNNINVINKLEETLNRKLNTNELNIVYALAVFKSKGLFIPKGSLKNTLRYNVDIIENFKYSSYKLMVKLKNKEKLTLEEKKRLSRKFNKAIILNRFSSNTMSYFNEIGMKNTITKNKEKLYSLLKNRENKFNNIDAEKMLGEGLLCTSETVCIRVLNLFRLIDTEEYYKIHLNDNKIAEYYDNHPIISIDEKNIEIAIAYWLWSCIRDEYNEKLNEIRKESNKYKLYSLKLLRAGNTSRLADNFDIVILMDKVLCDFYNFESLSDITNKSKLKSYGLEEKINNKFSDMQLKYIIDLLDTPKLHLNNNGLSVLLNIVLKYNGVNTIKTEIDNIESDIITNSLIDLDTINKIKTKVNKISIRLKEIKLKNKWSNDIQEEIEYENNRIISLNSIIDKLIKIKRIEEDLKYELEKNKAEDIKQLKEKQSEIIEELKVSDYDVYSSITIEKYTKNLNKLDNNNIRNTIKMLSKSRKELIYTIPDSELAEILESESLKISKELKNKSVLNSKILLSYPSISVVLALVKEYSSICSNKPSYYKEMSIASIGNKLSTTLKYITNSFSIISINKSGNTSMKEILYLMLDYLHEQKNGESDLSIELLLYGFSVRTANKLIHLYRSYKNGMNSDYMNNIATGLINISETDSLLIQDVLSLKNNDIYTKGLKTFIEYLKNDLYLFRTIERRDRL